MKKTTLALLLTLNSTVLAANYTFTKITDSNSLSGIKLTDLSYLSINSAGRVVFRASTTDTKGNLTGDIILSGSGGALTNIADSTGNFRSIYPTAINSQGVAVMIASSKDLVTYGVYTGAGGPLTTVIQTTAGTDSVVLPTSRSDINDAGDVVFVEGFNVQFYSNGTIRVVDPADAYFAGMLGQMNRAGTVVFNATSKETGQAVMLTDSGGTLNTLPVDAKYTFTPYRAAINDNGTIVGLALQEVPFRDVLIKIEGSTVTPVDTGSFTSLSVANVNNSGTIAFGDVSGIGNALKGIYIGPDPAADKVIAIGDTLFGGKVGALSGVSQSSGPGRFLNDNGQIAFFYVLADSTIGVAVASPASAPSAAPILPAGSIVSAASFSAVPALAPGMAVSIFGENFATGFVAASTPTLPTTLGGATVTFNGTAAPLYFVSATQINAQIPTELNTPNAVVQVTTPGGVSEQRTISLATVAPSVYTFNQSGTGQGVVTFAGTATLAAPRGLTPDSRPAHAGDIVTIYATGLGLVNPAIASGQNSCGGICAADGSNVVLRTTMIAPDVEIAGVHVPAENVLFSGLAPQFVGLYQINVQIPSGIPAGDASTLVLYQGSAASPSGVTIATE